MAKKRKAAAENWQPVIYETQAGQRPALTYLTDPAMPASVRRELLVTIVAVVSVGPPRFPTSTPRWSIMHKPKKKSEVDMSGICEARDQQSGKLYRLFCLIDRSAEDHGLQAPSLVLLGGATKPDRRAMPQSTYGLIDGYRDDYLSTRRIARDAESSAFWPDLTNVKP